VSNDEELFDKMEIGMKRSEFKKVIDDSFKNNNVCKVHNKVNGICPSKRTRIGLSQTMKLKKDLEDKKNIVKGFPLVATNIETRKE